ncbi:MAG TPA: NlpC/P60 family protein [Marmoricola sp.]
MFDGRKRVALFLAFLTALAGIGLSAALPANADPSIASVQQRVDRLYRQAEVASERYNAARDSLKGSQTKLKALDADLSRQQATVQQMRHQVAALVVDQYQGQTLSTASQLMLSNKPGAFVDSLNAVSAYNTQRGQLIKQYAQELQRLRLRKQAVSDEVAALAKTKRTLGKEKAQVDAKAAAAKRLLAKLTAKQRQKMAAQAAPAPTPSASTASVPASGRAAAAVQYAMAQVGKPYVYGAAGPDAYDCSGLTMAAWGSAGVSLPHSAAAQYSSGPHISESQLQPGDLVFYYSGPSHVGMYIGNGKIVNAENPSVGVVVADLHSMPYVGAVRPG